MDQNTHILYIEDDVDNQRLVSRILKNSDFSLKILPDSQTALSYLDSNTPKLILVDIGLPDMDGKSFTKKVKERKDLTNIPIVALTAHVLRSDKESILASGCNGYIPKPINVDKFQEQITQFLIPSLSLE
ncbi:MAG: response regulator [Chloroflexota bacterium]